MLKAKVPKQRGCEGYCHPSFVIRLRGVVEDPLQVDVKDH